MRTFGCDHKWNKESEVILPSAFEQASKGGAKEFYQFSWFFVKTHIVILSCTECGKIYKSVEESKL